MPLDTGPWAPDPDRAVGTPPPNGERGSSVFDGTPEFNADGTARGTNPLRGPRRGIDYAPAGAVQPYTGIATSLVESAGSTEPITIATAVADASTLTPAANASVTLTATYTSPSDFPISGTVTFKDGATTLGTADVDVDEVATYVHAAGFAAGAHSITAVLPASTRFATTTTPAITVTAS